MTAPGDREAGRTGVGRTGVGRTGVGRTGVSRTEVSRTALVTGASSGIGAATARALAAAGTTVALVARRADRLDEVLADCRRTAPESDRWVADLSNPEAAATLAEAIWDSYGHLDVVVNNAGAPMRRAVTRLTLAEVEGAVQL